MNFKDKLHASMTAAVDQGHGSETLYGADFETVMELETNTVTIEEAEMAELEVMTSLVEDAEMSLTELSETVMATVANGGMSDDGLNVVMAGVQAIGRPLGGVTIELPSGEAFGQDGGRVEATEMAGEAIKEKAKELKDNVVKFIASMIAKARELFVSYVSAAGRTLKAANKLKEMTSKLSGKPNSTKFDFKLGALLDKDGSRALPVNVVKAVPNWVGKIKEGDVNKAYEELAAALKAADFSDLDALYSKIDAIAPAAVSTFALSKELSAEEKKAVKMGEKYEKVTGTVLGDGTVIALGTPKSGSSIGPRLAVGNVGAKQKDKEVPVLDIAGVKAFADVAVDSLEVSVEIAKKGQKTTDAAAKVVDALKAFEKARKAAKLEGNSKEKASKVKGKVKDAMTIAAVGFKAYTKHLQATGIASYNYALKSSKQYKKEESDK